MSAHVVERLSAYLDGELPGAEREAVEVHLRGCDECAQHLADFAAVDALARDLPLEAPAGYFEALPSRVRFKVTPRRRAPRLPAWSWAVAAALVVAVVTPILLRESPRPDEVARSMAPPAPQAVERLDQAATPTAAPQVAAEALTTPAAGLGADREQAPSASSRDERRARANEGLGLRKEAQDAAAEAPAAPPPAAAPVAGGSAIGSLARNDAPAELAKAREPVAKDKLLEAVPPPGRTASAPAASASATLAAPPEQGAAGQHLYEPKAESDLADAVAPATEEAKKTKSAAKPAAAVETEALAPPRIRFRTLEAEVPESVEAARRLREQWRAFVAQGVPFRQADEARVRMVEVGVRAFRLSNDPADLLLARRDAEAYLRRDDAAQGDRVRSLLATLGN